MLTARVVRYRRERWLTPQGETIRVSISKRQVVRLLIDQQDGFLTETREVLPAGLETADWVTVDDTGTRHRGANGVCTQIGNDTFAWFGTTDSKSRLNFLDLLRARHTDYVIHDATSKASSCERGKPDGSADGGM